MVLLLQHSLTFRDVVAFVAEAQRTFLNIYAFLDFVEVLMPRLTFPSASHPVQTDWMGTFTQDTAVCDELFRTSIPVWLTRLDFTITEDTIIENPVTFSFPDHIK